MGVFLVRGMRWVLRAGWAVAVLLGLNEGALTESLGGQMPGQEGAFEQKAILEKGSSESGWHSPGSRGSEGISRGKSGGAGGETEPLAEGVRALTRALQDPDAGVRESAVYALRSMGRAAKDSIPALGEAVRDRDGYVRAIAGRTLARFGEAAVPTLAALLKDRRPEVRLVAAEALRTMEVEAKGAVESLAQALRDSSPAVRETAAHALRNLGPEAQPAIPALQEAVADQDGYVRSAAARALVRIGPASLPALGELLRHPDERVRRVAAEAMQTIGVETTDARMK